jgi:rubrerythrin
MKRVIVVLSLLMSAGVLLSPSVCFADEKQEAQSSTVLQPSKTLSNLMQDYNTAANIKEKYTTYAQKADQEGYKKVAQLFRAAAKSIDVHLGFQAKNIAGLGGTPKADIKQPVVKSTKENIEDAIKSEESEAGMLYPKYLDQAKAENLKMPAMAFDSGLKIEVNRKTLLQEASSNLKSWKKPAKNGFYVCKVCGNLVPILNFTNCPVCGAPVSAFEKVE